jgi:serine/threonine-protein kinase RsbW
MMHTFKVACQRENLRQVREFVNIVLSEEKLSELEINQLVLAVDEICSNLIIYAHPNNHSEELEVSILTMEKEGDDIVFEITDRQADSFDMKTYQEPDLNQIIEEKRKGGMGLMLVHRIMDSIEIRTDGRTTIWRMSKKITPKA